MCIVVQLPGCVKIIFLDQSFLDDGDTEAAFTSVNYIDVVAIPEDPVDNIFGRSSAGYMVALSERETSEWGRREDERVREEQGEKDTMSVLETIQREETYLGIPANGL